jgi:hypothetical protein
MESLTKPDDCGLRAVADAFVEVTFHKRHMSLMTANTRPTLPNPGQGSVAPRSNC